MAMREKRFVIKLLLKAAFEASTPEIRFQAMASYYNYLMAFQQKSKLSTDLKTLSRRINANYMQNLVTIDAATESTVQVVRSSQSSETEETSSSDTASQHDNGREPATITSLPNEILDSIIRLILNGVTGVQSFQDLPILMVSHRFLEVAIRHLLSNELFTFYSAKVDRNFYVDNADVQWQGAKVVTPSSFHIVELPEHSIFDQEGGKLSLRSLSRSPFAWLPDPLTLITKLTIAITLPRTCMYTPQPNAPVGSAGFIARRLSHPYMPLQNVTTGHVMRWLEAEFTHQKAEYHFGILKQLPFNNLHRLEVELVGGAFTEDEPNRALARWMGRYMHHISIEEKAGSVRLLLRDPRLIGIADELSDLVLEPWFQDL